MLKYGIHKRDILYFSTISTKANNGSFNSIREKIIMNIVNHNMSKFANDIIYGEKWLQLINSTNIIIDKITNNLKITNHNKILLERGYNNILDSNLSKIKSNLANVDFVINYYDNTKLLHTEPIEFKFNSKKLSSVPQLIQDNDAHIECPSTIPTFIEYSFNNLLNENMMKELDLTKPSFEEYNKYMSILFPIKKWYMKDIYNDFFKQLRLKTANNKIFRELEKKVRSDYISIYGKDRISIEYIKNILIKQTKKKFILYDNNKFTLHQIDCINIDNIIYIESTSKFALQFTDMINIYEYRLCWKNTNGILNPAWKFAIKKSL
jgi:hypothetical protein